MFNTRARLAGQNELGAGRQGVFHLEGPLKVFYLLAERCQVVIVQGHEIDFLFARDFHGVLKPLSCLVEPPQLAGVAG